MFIDFTETEEGKERKRERPQPGIEPATSVCALTRNGTSNMLVYGMMLQPTEPPSQGWLEILGE